MQPTYGFMVQENCLTCVWRTSRTFCNLAGAALRHLQRIAVLSVHPAGTILYNDGNRPRGVFILCNGRAKVCTTSRGHGTVIFKMAEPGEVLGLEAVLSHHSHRETAELLDSCQVKFIAKSDLFEFLCKHNPPAVHAALQLAANSEAARQQVRRIGLSVSGTQKLARQLIAWVETFSPGETHKKSFPLPYTHEEVAQMIGSTRETVTRTLSKLKIKGVIEMRGEIMFIRKLDFLRRLAREEISHT